MTAGLGIFGCTGEEQAKAPVITITPASIRQSPTPQVSPSNPLLSPPGSTPISSTPFPFPSLTPLPLPSPSPVILAAPATITLGEPLTFGLAVALSAGLAAGESIQIQLTQGPLAWSFPFTPEAVGCAAGSTTCAVNLTLTLPASVTAGSYVLSAQVTTLTPEVFTAGQPLVIVANAGNVSASPTPAPTPAPTSTPTISPSPGGSPTPTPAVSPLSSCREWILTGDFQAFPNQSNPNPDSCGAESIWAFQRGPAEAEDPAQFLLLTQFLPNTFGISGLETWQGITPDPQEATVNFPWVGLNTSREPQGSWPEGAIQVHPAPTEQVILRWRSPVQGTVLIEGSVSQPEQGGGDGVSWRIQQGSTILFAGAIPDLGSQNFSVRTATTLNESIYLIIDPNTSNLSDATQVELRIVQES